jgi:hypothetical protein
MPLVAYGIPLRIANILSRKTRHAGDCHPKSAACGWCDYFDPGLVVGVAWQVHAAVHDVWRLAHASAVNTRLSQAGIETFLVHQSELERTLMVLVRQA